MTDDASSPTTADGSVHERPPKATERVQIAHEQRWGRPEFVVRAPGRVNLIGEHTDYNDGFCLPMALPFDTAFAVSRTPGSTIELVSEGFGSCTIDPKNPGHDIVDWGLYVAGVAWLMEEYDLASGGWQACIASDVPTGASLSSSAALEVGAIRTILELHGESWEPIEIAALGQRVENEIIGVPSGILDQFISAGAVGGSASLMDCREFTLTPAPLPAGTQIAIMDTGTRRRLVEGEYGARRDACFRAAEALGVAALRDATLADLEAIRESMPLEYRRAHHVVTENARTQKAAEVMADCDAAAFGQLMNESHASLRDDYEVSGPALDHIVEIALDSRGCLGARMTGGGFAGAAVALVEEDKIDEFNRSLSRKYMWEGHRATVWMCTAAPGAGTVPLV